MPVPVILFFFGLANAAVEFSSVGSRTWDVDRRVVSPGWKTAWIALLTICAVAAGFRLPGGLSYRHTLLVKWRPA